ncbi:MAG TPA: DUF4118 domain-containing protein [Anaerolineaceae bacterium]|nr:DUF4118 domain-containing protein [Anaerolineaceae bacterium]HQN04154.1 DUF4118 domain-containing protein [Anaerolineaceae bacterium]HQP08831.1 DUF4118 domain-containing protein [Anaerolineaceae bacterium]
MKIFQASALRIGFQIVAGIFFTAIITLMMYPIREFLGSQIVALIFLLPVLFSVYFLGLLPAIITSVTSFLCLNYFFIPPYYSFLVHKGQDFVSLLVFFLIAVFTSQLIDKARKGTQLAQQHEMEATSLYQLLLALSGKADAGSIAGTVAEHTMRTIPCSRVEVILNSSKAIPPFVINKPGNVTNEISWHLFSYPMLSSRSDEGVLQVWVDHPVLSGEEDRLLSMYAAQGAQALERARLVAVETHAHILEETDQAKSTLLASVSHELRSPLAVIKASVSSLRSGLVDWDLEARLDLLSSIEEETDHLNFLVGNLLDMSRIEAGALTLHKKWNSLLEIANESLQHMQKVLEPFRVEVGIPSDLPLVYTDFILLDQVYTNLLSNSVKFASPGSRISLLAYPEEENVHAIVENEGPGVPEEDLDRIFEKFHQLHKNDRVMGTGLGLSICKGIVSSHGGKIWAENLQKGFAFHFTLPARPAGEPLHIPMEEEDE